MTVPALATLLRNRRWVRITDPFPHYYACDVFKPDVHFAIERTIRDLVGCGYSEKPARGRLSRSMPGYDAYGYTPRDEDIPPSLQVFFSRAWHDMLASVTGVPATGHIQAGLHHHRIGSASGTVHNDFAASWFAEVPSAEGLIPSRAELCDFKTGKRFVEGIPLRRVVRAASMIYFAGNGTWCDGDGGGTGLYRSGKDPVDEPEAVIPPVNNSLVLFEITPHSFHSFITNTAKERNSVITFLHCEYDYATTRWGPNLLVEWGKS